MWMELPGVPCSSVQVPSTMYRWLVSPPSRERERVTQTTARRMAATKRERLPQAFIRWPSGGCCYRVTSTIARFGRDYREVNRKRMFATNPTGAEPGGLDPGQRNVPGPAQGRT